MSGVKFYAYLGNAEFGEESLRHGRIMIIDDLKTVKGAIKRCRRYWGIEKFRIYSFTNFYDGNTFTRVY